VALSMASSVSCGCDFAIPQSTLQELLAAGNVGADAVRASTRCAPTGTVPQPDHATPDSARPPSALATTSRVSADNSALAAALLVAEASHTERQRARLSRAHCVMRCPNCSAERFVDRRHGAVDPVARCAGCGASFCDGCRQILARPVALGTEEGCHADSALEAAMQRHRAQWGCRKRRHSPWIDEPLALLGDVGDVYRRYEQAGRADDLLLRMADILTEWAQLDCQRCPTCARGRNLLRTPNAPLPGQSAIVDCPCRVPYCYLCERALPRSDDPDAQRSGMDAERGPASGVPSSPSTHACVDGAEPAMSVAPCTGGAAAAAAAPVPARYHYAQHAQDGDARNGLAGACPLRLADLPHPADAVYNGCALPYADDAGPSDVLASAAVCTSEPRAGHEHIMPSHERSGGVATATERAALRHFHTARQRELLCRFVRYCLAATNTAAASATPLPRGDDGSACGCGGRPLLADVDGDNLLRQVIARCPDEVARTVWLLTGFACY